MEFPPSELAGNSSFRLRNRGRTMRDSPARRRPRNAPRRMRWTWEPRVATTKTHYCLASWSRRRVCLLELSGFE